MDIPKIDVLVLRNKIEAGGLTTLLYILSKKASLTIKKSSSSWLANNEPLLRVIPENRAVDSDRLHFEKIGYWLQSFSRRMTI